VRIEDENQMGNTIVVEGTIYESSMANPGAPSPQTDIVMIEGNIGVGAACVPPNGHNAELEAAANVRMCEPEEVEYFSSDGQNGPSSGSVPADQQDEAPTGESGESTEESGGTSGEGTEDTTGEETGGTSGEDTQATSGEGTEETTLDDSSGGTEEETPDETAGQTPEETDDDKGPIRDAVEEHDDGGCSVTPQEAQRLAELSHGKVSVKGMNDGLVQLGLIGSVVAGIYALRRRFAKN